jgi:hypothetical protein
MEKKMYEGCGRHKAAKNVKEAMAARKVARSSSKNISIIPSDGITVKEGNNMFHISDKSVETIAGIIKLVLGNPELVEKHGGILLGLAGKYKYADTLLRDRKEKEDNLAEFLRATQPNTKSIKDLEE